MSTTTATAPAKSKELPKLHETTVALAEKLGDMMTIDTNTGQINVVQDAYERLLPPDIPLAMVKALKTHEQHLFAAAFEAVGNMSREYAHKHNGLDRTQAELPLTGHDRFDITWHRTVERNAGLPKDGQPAEKKTVYGAMTGALRISSADASRGELNKVAIRQKAAALEMFGAK